jgi:formylmethanofuran dehydrogenase subunit E
MSKSKKGKGTQALIHEFRDKRRKRYGYANVTERQNKRANKILSLKCDRCEDNEDVREYKVLYDRGSYVCGTCGTTLVAKKVIAKVEPSKHRGSKSKSDKAKDSLSDPDEEND